MNVWVTVERDGMHFGEEIINVVGETEYTREEIKEIFNIDSGLLDFLEATFATDDKVHYVGERIYGVERRTYFFHKGRYYSHAESDWSSSVKKRVTATHSDFKLLENQFIKNRVLDICGFKYDMATGEHKISLIYFGQNDANYANEMIRIWTPLKAQIVKVDNDWQLVAIE